MANPTEEWRVIIGAPDYEVSNFGRVRSFKGKSRRILKPTPDTDGYLQVVLRHWGKSFTKKIHHLVLDAFTGLRPEGLQTAHLDGNPANNHVSNLKWATSVENSSHKDIHGTRPKGDTHKNSLLRSCDVLRIREASLFGADIKDLTAVYGRHRITLHDVIHRRTWKHV